MPTPKQVRDQQFEDFKEAVKRLAEAGHQPQVRMVSWDEYQRILKEYEAKGIPEMHDEILGE